MNMHVAPKHARPARLAALPKLPLFLDLKGKNVLLIGSSDAVAWKAELLAAAGAQVRVCVTEACEEMEHLANGERPIRLIRRPWRASDLDDTRLVVADAAGLDDLSHLSAAARSRGVLLNIIDVPALCDFQFGTIVNRAPVVIAISTDGAAPILGQAIRRRIEAVLPTSLGAWTMAAKMFRGRLKELVQSRTARREFWERFVDLTFMSKSSDDAQFVRLERLARDVLEADSARPGGEVIIVGAGPGDPELLTMKAVRELQAADVILYDRLVSPAVLELGRREARRVMVGKTGHGPRCRQTDINTLMIAEARQGHRVVRLKGGDPAIFGRTGEEVAACRDAGIGVRIVPGITSASAAAATLGLSLTQRDRAQRVQFVTGHDQHGELPADLDLGALADPRSTTVVYMGRRTIGKLAREMISGGLARSTPAIVVSNVSCATERHVETDIGRLLSSTDVDNDEPTLVLIGSAMIPSPALQDRC